jgi:hypothetical protein
MALYHHDHREDPDDVYRNEARWGFELQTQRLNSNGV